MPQPNLNERLEVLEQTLLIQRRQLTRLYRALKVALVSDVTIELSEVSPGVWGVPNSKPGEIRDTK